MAVIRIAEGVDFAGSIDWDRRLFDELIPLPEGTSYNSYFIKGSEKTALIDTVDPTKTHELFTNLDYLGIKKIDYVIANHAEQDHSGSLDAVVKKYPGVKIVTNEKCKGFVMEFMPALKNEDFIVVADKQELSLGNRTLQFHITPWVHWPETMVTFLKEDRILFSCDFFGSHAEPCDLFEDSDLHLKAKRYYAEIMSPFRNVIKKNIEIVEALDPKIIAPSHGIVHLNPSKIIGYYKEWVSDDTKNEVLIGYVSMHNSMKAAAEYLTDALVNKGVVVSLYNLTKTDIGNLAMDLLDASTVVLCAPTVLAGAHPTAAATAYLFNALRPKTKFLSLVTGYSWAERAQESLAGFVKSIKPEIVEPVKINGFPKKADFEALDKLALAIIEKHKQIGVMK